MSYLLCCSKIFDLNNCYPKIICYFCQQYEEVLPDIADALLDAFAFSTISASRRYNRYHITIERY